MSRSILKMTLLIFILSIAYGSWFLYSEIYRESTQATAPVTFEIKSGEGIRALGNRLEKEGVIRMPSLFNYYVRFKGVDRKIQAGMVTVQPPVTLARVVYAMTDAVSRSEREITILPGWDLRDIAEYFEKEHIAKADDVYALLGRPAVDYRQTKKPETMLAAPSLTIVKDKPEFLSYEGYLAPETYRIYKDATLEEIMKKLLAERDEQFSDEMYHDIDAQKRTVFDVLTIASIVEREVRTPEDRAIVADIFWRRIDAHMGLEADSTIHFLTGKKGDVFTTKEDRDSLSSWNTYRYAGLPLGQISTPSLASIQAAIHPKANDYWYFLTDLKEGNVYYAKTLEQHNANRNKYLR